MRTDKELDELYERANVAPGWLSYLLEANAVDEKEAEYLSWRDECEAPVKAKIRQWEMQIESHGGIDLENAETQEERLAAVTKRIKEIEKKCLSFPFQIQEAIRETTNYHRLVSLRGQLIVEIDPPKLLPDEMVRKARAYRLDDLLKDKLKKRFMNCPIHPEKHGSFFVTSFGFCFGCLRSWNAIGWLMDFEKMSFKEAVQYLAQK